MTGDKQIDGFIEQIRKTDIFDENKGGIAMPEWLMTVLEICLACVAVSFATLFLFSLLAIGITCVRELKVSVDWLIGNEPAELTGRWDLYNGTGMTAIYRCSQCGNKTGPGLKNRNYCEVCGSRNVRWAVRGKPGRKKEEA